MNIWLEIAENAIRQCIARNPIGAAPIGLGAHVKKEFDMDYRDLLTKYIGHVHDQEGTAFVDGYEVDRDFTAEEKKVLQELDKLANGE